MPDLKDPQWLEWLAGVDPFSAGYLGCDSEHHPIRLAHALHDLWASMPVTIEPSDLLVGRTRGQGIGGFSFGGGIQCNAEEAERLKEQFPRWREHLDSLVSFWNGWGPSSRVKLPDDEPLMNGQNVYWAGWGGHAVLGFEKLLGLTLKKIFFEPGIRPATFWSFRKQIRSRTSSMSSFRARLKRITGLSK